MRSNIIIASLLLLITACGNPHVSKSRGGLEKIHPPLSTRQNEQDGCKPLVHGKYEFFFEESGDYPFEFVHVLKCKKLITEDFDHYPKGQTFHVTNRGKETHHYELVHMLERNSQITKNTYLEDIFGDEHYPLLIKESIVNSMDADENFKDALVWSFSSPVKSWGIKTLSLDSPGLAPAKLRLFDCSKSLVHEVNVVFSEKTKTQFIGFMAGHPPVCHITLSTGKNAGFIEIEEMIYSE